MKPTNTFKPPSTDQTRTIIFFFLHFPVDLTGSSVQVGAVPQVGRVGSLSARPDSAEAARGSCSLKQQMLISQADHGEYSSDAFPLKMYTFENVSTRSSLHTERLEGGPAPRLSPRGAPLAPGSCLPSCVIAGCHLHFLLEHL